MSNRDEQWWTYHTYISILKCHVSRLRAPPPLLPFAAAAVSSAFGFPSFDSQLHAKQFCLSFSLPLSLSLSLSFSLSPSLCLCTYVVMLSIEMFALGLVSSQRLPLGSLCTSPPYSQLAVCAICRLEMNLLNPWHSIHFNSLAFHRFRASFVPFLMSVDLAGGTALYCRQAPEEGGATCFADAASAWEGLAFDQQRYLLLLGTIDTSRDNYATYAIYDTMPPMLWNRSEKSEKIYTADCCWRWTIWLRKGSTLHTSPAPLWSLLLVRTFKENDSGIFRVRSHGPTQETGLHLQLGPPWCQAAKAQSWLSDAYRGGPVEDSGWDDFMHFHAVSVGWNLVEIESPFPWWVKIPLNNFWMSQNGSKFLSTNARCRHFSWRLWRLWLLWLLWLLCPAQSLQERKRNPPRRVPLSLQHPETGRRAIYGINSSTCFVVEKGQEPRLILFSLLISTNHLSILNFTQKGWWNFPGSQRFACGAYNGE